MRLIFTITFFIVSIAGYSQNITGIWRGTFVQRQPNPFTGEWESFVFKYEVQIHQVNSKTIEGVTYSYRQKDFYGKAAFKGLYTKATKNILLKETKMVEMKIAETSVPCLMTCYLDYSKSGGIERLTGNFSSIESTDKKNCGGGTVSLQRVLASDFKKESFLLKKPVAPSNKPNPVQKNIEVQKKPSSNAPVNKSNPVVKNSVSQPKNASQNKTEIKPKQSAVSTSIESGNKPSEKISTTIIPDVPQKIITEANAASITSVKPAEIPEILKSRTNKFVTKVVVNVKKITVDYYDNGEIDGDIISVYDNNKMVLDHDTLSTRPLRLNIVSDENNTVHELITVAENLGRIPPNTCLMIITAGRQRFEIPMSSDEKTNAKVLIEYLPKEETRITNVIN